MKRRRLLFAVAFQRAHATFSFLGHLAGEMHVQYF